MMKDNVKKLQKAAQEYILKDEYNIAENLQTYIKTRIQANEMEICELLKLEKAKITFADILHLFELEEEAPYKNYQNMKINDHFLSVEVQMPVGIVAVEAYETLEVIKYFIKAIQTRNAIAISDVEYAENNVKSLVLLIFQEALKKFNIDENLIMILPFEECFYEDFDEVIHTYDEQGFLLEQPKVTKKEYGDKNFIYLENENLRQEAQKNENAEILQGDFTEILPKMDQQKAAVIYTKNSNIAYEFINLVRCKNVFVNTNLENCKTIENSNSIFSQTRYMIIPLPENKESAEKIHSTTENLDLIVKKENIFVKIKNILKMIFGK